MHILYMYLFVKNEHEIFSEKNLLFKSSNRKIPDGKRNLEVNEGIKCSLKDMTKGEKQKHDFFKMKFNWILS